MYRIIHKSQLKSLNVFYLNKSGPGVGGKSVRQADVSGGTHFPGKFCPTGQDMLSASRIMCPGLGGISIRQKCVRA